MIPAEEIRQGDTLRILPGETIPVDGTIIHGETSVDQSIMTGESLPVDKSVGDEVFCGTINRFGSIDKMCIRDRSCGIAELLEQLCNRFKSLCLAHPGFNRFQIGLHIMGMGQRGIFPVSYTHLDVYKRQPS